MSKYTCLIVFFFLVGLRLHAQTPSGKTHRIKGIVTDSHDRNALPAVTVKLSRKGRFLKGTVTNADGRFELTEIEEGNVSLNVSLIGYEPVDTTLWLTRDADLSIVLTSGAQHLNEVVVTASEKKGMTATSIIGQVAMEHLQPSSFTDLLALLPGSMTKLPNMGSANVIRLREVGIASGQYATSSLGTKFIIDGQTIGTDANMQYVQGATQSDEDSERNHTDYGVDMRTIPTDNIEKVEIVRGIPSVKYGDLTSGLINITRKQSYTPLQARFKADEYGKLLSVGKGFEFANQWKLNVDGGLLLSKADPRNRFETYTRVTLSARTQKKWNLNDVWTMQWNGTGDYATTIDNVKTDPEVQISLEDSYRSSYNKFGLNNRLTFENHGETWLKRIAFSYAASLAIDKIHQVELVSLDRDRTVPMVYESGEYDGKFLSRHYISDYRVEGLPFYSTLKSEAEWVKKTWEITHQFTVGGEWQLNKNYGRGQIFDLERPLHASASRRPRSYKNIPATSIASSFIEEYATLPLGKHQFSLMAGVRTTQMLNLDKAYTMYGKTYYDARLNVQWDFSVAKEWNLYLSGGVGRMTKMPIMADLYPDYVYKDITQMSYWHINPAYKRINIRTYKINPTNYNLQPARNRKWELRFGSDYKNHHFNITYFNEDMKDGFRSVAEVAPYIYKAYDTSTINPSTLTGPPSLEGLTYVTDTVLGSYGRTVNGSRIMKEGIEFQYASPRIKYIHTRITVNGAWFHTVYENSRPEYKSNSLAVLGKVVINDKYMGYYQTTDRYNKYQFTSNIIADTYLDRLGMILSATAECYWIGKTYRPATSAVPIGYMDTSGELKPYTEADRKHPYKRWLVLTGTAGQSLDSKERFYMLVNFKATKKFGHHLSLSFFADRFLSIAPDYTVGEFIIRRSFSSYFGMELNIKI